ncbi:hypothetical protein QBC39DRAFT_345842 [Podospora conica]|nr:hypothetical protein QBC39DRAFT_345842 [Schizothecium conicum]
MATLQISDLLVDTYTKGLNTLLHILDVAASHAAANGVDPSTYLDARLVEDQRPLSFQIQNATRQVRLVVGRVTGTEIPGVEDTEKTVDEFRARIASALEFLKGVDRKGIDEFVERGESVTQPFGPGLSTQVSAKDAVLGHAIPNFYFHVSTAYGILRARGVPVGKKDWIREWFSPNQIPKA